MSPVEKMTNAEFNEQFCERTKCFAIAIVLFVESLPFNTATKVLGNQLSKSGTSVGANFRAFCRGRSKNEKFAKICIVVEEADEVLYWLDVISALPYANKTTLQYRCVEGLEILKLASSIKNGLYQ